MKRSRTIYKEEIFELIGLDNDKHVLRAYNALLEYTFQGQGQGVRKK